jgi:hypothetical protein
LTGVLQIPFEASAMDITAEDVASIDNVQTGYLCTRAVLVRSEAPGHQPRWCVWRQMDPDRVWHAVSGNLTVRPSEDTVRFLTWFSMPIIVACDELHDWLGAHCDDVGLRW